MGHQEPASHCYTTYQTYLEYIQWSGGKSYGFITANAISFGSDLLTRKCQIFIQLQSTTWHSLASTGHQEPSSHCYITYQTHMEYLKVSHMVSLLPMPSVLAQICCQSAKFSSNCSA
jgi:hypothetical protein